MHMMRVAYIDPNLNENPRGKGRLLPSGVLDYESLCE